MHNKGDLNTFELFLNKFFKDNFLVADNRFLPYVSGLYKNHDLFSLNSMKVYIKGSVDNKQCYYPDGEARKEYEGLIGNGLIIDMIVIPQKDFILYSDASFSFHGYRVFINRENIELELSSLKGFHIDTDTNILLEHFQDEGKIISENLTAYKQEYICYLDIIQNKDYDLRFASMLLENYLIPKLYSIKNKIKIYTALGEKGYTNLDHFFNHKKNDITEIKYDKNIAIQKGEYIGKVYKVHDIDSSKKLKKNDIMVAYNTNPEFLEAFYRSSIICVESSSELSHAAITCRELDIPLALGAKNIFFSTENNEIITIDTENKIIKLK